MKNTKTKLISSVTVLLICFAMLIGSTFAWFTDSASTGVNKIQAGTLDIEAYYQDANPDGPLSYIVDSNGTRISTVKFSETKKDLEGSKLVDESVIFEPGYVGAKLITVENKGNLAAKLALKVSTQDHGLQDALWFDFIMVNDRTVIGDLEQRRMSIINQFAENVQVPVAANNGKASFIFIYGMDESAGNTYQGKSFEASVTIVAKQNTVESDSFDNQYDDSAAYPTVWNGTEITTPVADENGVMKVSNGAELAGALASNPNNITIELTDDIFLGGNPWGPYNLSDVNLTIDGKGHTIKGLNPVGTVRNSNDWIKASGLISHITTSTVTFKDLTISGATVTNTSKTDGDPYCAAAAFVGRILDNSHVVTFENCHIVNSNIAGAEYAGGFVGYLENYGSPNGSIVINDCSVKNSSFNGNDATGTLVALNNMPTTINRAFITGNTVNGGNGYSASALVGTSNGGTTATNVSASNNTFVASGLDISYAIYNSQYGYVVTGANDYFVNGVNLKQ